MAGVVVELSACEPPRAPTLAYGQGAVALRLARRLLALDDASLGALECGLAGDDVLLVRGTGERLPWVDGVRYLAPLPGAPELLLPTHAQLAVPAELLARALHREQPGAHAWLQLSGGDALVSLSALRAPGRARLQRLCDAWGGRS